jgi:hypothetical protein
MLKGREKWGYGFEALIVLLILHINMDWLIFFRHDNLL